MAEQHKAKVYVPPSGATGHGAAGHHAHGHGHGAAGHHAPEHVHGTMDITEHQKTFEGFIRFWVYVFGGSAAILIFLALFST